MDACSVESQRISCRLEENLIGSKKLAGRKVLRSNMAQACKSPSFLLAVAGTMLVLGIGVFTDLIKAFRSEELLECGFHRTLVEHAIQSDPFLFALSLVCVLPYTTAYLDDRKSGFIKAYLPRTGRKNYLAGKMTACMVSGGLAPVLGILLDLFVAALVFSPMELAKEPVPFDTQTQAWMLSFLQTLLLVFLSGAFWAMAGMAAAAVTSSRYMAYAATFIFYYLLVILCERYFKSYYIFYPKEWLVPRNFPYGWLGVVIFLTEALLLLCGVFFCREERRLERL